MSILRAVQPALAALQRRPAFLTQHTDRLLRQALHVARELRQRDVLVYSVIDGQLPNGGGPLSLHYIGRQRFAQDFYVFFERSVPELAPRQRLVDSNALSVLWQRGRLPACPAGADVLIVDRFMAPEARGATVAPFINAVLPVQQSVEAQLELIRSKGHRRKLQAAYKRGFCWRRSNNAADFDLFYEIMYAPFVQERFGEGASIVPRDEMFREYSRRGFLLLLEVEGRPVSGALMYTSRQRPESLAYWKYGIAAANELSPAAFGERNATTEAMVLQYAVTEGYKELDFGLTRAMPNDGIFTHKKRLGCDFRKPPFAPEFSLHIAPATRPRLLARFPQVVLQSGAMHAWTGHEGELGGRRAETLQESLRACGFASLQSVRLYTHGVDGSAEALQLAVQTVKAELHCPIFIESRG